MENDTISYLRDSVCPTGIVASLYNEYIILPPHAQAQEHTGRFIDIQATDAYTLSLLFADITTDMIDAFANGDAVCILDYFTARNCNLLIGDTLSIRGRAYTVSYITAEQKSCICIPYSTLSPGIAYPHTLYLLYDSPVTEDTICSTMTAVFPETEKGNVVSLRESYQMDHSITMSTLVLVILITGVYLLCAIVNISLIRYGDMQLHRHDLAVSLAIGCSKPAFILGILIEILMITPLAILCNVILFYGITYLVPFPYALSISPLVILLSFLLSFLCSCVVSVVCANRFFKQPLFQPYQWLLEQPCNAM